MAVKRENSAGRADVPNVAAFAEARWFAGKGRVVSGVEVVGDFAPDGADGASVAFVDVEYESSERERYALALREGRECAGDDSLWAALARAAGEPTWLQASLGSWPRTCPTRSYRSTTAWS
jgi:hypothetical protein